MSAGEAARWRKQVFTIDEPEDIPYYQLLLGDLDEADVLKASENLRATLGRIADPRGCDSAQFETVTGSAGSREDGRPGSGRGCEPASGDGGELGGRAEVVGSTSP